MPEGSRDGVRLAYDAVDGARRALVFIHGWCCDRSYLAPQARHFAAAGHRVLSPDLRGHGASDAPEGAYAMDVFADDVAALCAALGIADAVVVGHSMGGIVAFEMARRHPERVAGLVMIDSAVARPAASRAALPAFIDRLRGPDAAALVADYARRVLFIPTDDAARRDRILAAMGRTPAHVMAAALRGMYDFDPASAADLAMPPSLFISSNAPPLCDLARLATLVPGLMTAQTAGSGHFAPLEVPDQVDAMIGRFLDVTANG
jgi:pimeloyl-ACP methyl ester carboxylesterase